MQEKENQDFVGQLPELGPVSPMNRSDSFDKISEKNEKDDDIEAIVQEAGEVHIEKAEDVAVQVISARDDPELPVFTFRAIFLGIGLSAFTSVRLYASIHEIEASLTSIPRRCLQRSTPSSRRTLPSRSSSA